MPETSFPLPPIIDVEASGFGSSSYPIEVGLVLADGQSYCSLIQPEDEWQHWDADAEKVHGLKRDTLAAHGRSAVEVAREVNQRLRGQVVYTDSWYHDFTWLSRLFDAGESAPSFRLEDLRSLLSEKEADNWHQAKTQVLAELNLPRHRASNDARVLQMTLKRVKQMDALAS